MTATAGVRSRRMSTRDRLAVVLVPRPPYRVPRAHTVSTWSGLQLQLADGSQLGWADPSLAAFGAVTPIVRTDADADGQSLQAASFAPGSEAELVVERGGDGLATVAVWDAGQVRRAGLLDGYEAEFVIAAAEHGLPHRALIVEELAASPDLRRTGIRLLVYSEWFVRLDTRRAARYRPPEGRRRRRVVMILEPSLELRWWDSAAASGPTSLDVLPLSAEVHGDVLALHRAARDIGNQRERAVGPAEHWELDWALGRLESEARVLWERVRAELAADHDVGLLLPGMANPVWTPEDLDDRDEWED